MLARRAKIRTRVRCFVGCLAALLPLCSAGVSRAQNEVPRLTDRPLPVPDFAPEPVTPGTILPTLDLPNDGQQRIANSPRIYVPSYQIVGNTVFSDSQLQEVTAPYSGREVSYEELLALRRALTLQYVRQGFVTSGATLSRVLEDGSIEFSITEGVLSDVQIEGERYFRPAHLRARAMPPQGSVVNIAALERRLKLLQEDPRIERIEAQLVPGMHVGESQLEIKVSEASPLSLSLGVSNHQSPGVGPERTEIGVSHLNLTGNADVLDASYSAAGGLRELSLGYRIPVTPAGTTLGARYSRTTSENREEPFDRLEIHSRSASYALELETPLYRDDRFEASLSASAEFRTSKTFLLGRGFPFSAGVERDGVTKVALVRAGQAMTYRDRRQALALRSTFTFGVDALGATVGREEPNGRFVTWLGRARWARRLGWLSSTLIARADVQLANDPVFSLEQFSVGGSASVRGYRENQLLRDIGIVASLELRIPVWRRASGESVLEVAPFYDFGSARNRRQSTENLQSLSSAGIGLIVQLGKQLRAELYVAEAFRDVPASSNQTDLQDRGVHFRIRTSY